MTPRAYMARAKSDDWATPMPFFEEFWREAGGFDLDPCGQKEVHPATHMIVQHGGYFFDGSTAEMDGLLQPWNAERVYMNPPYGAKDLLRWTTRAITELANGNVRREVWALLPAKKTEQKWWQENVMHEWSRDGESRVHSFVKAVRFLPGRLKFGSGESAPFPSCIVVWGKT